MRNTNRINITPYQILSLMYEARDPDDCIRIAYKDIASNFSVSIGVAYNRLKTLTEEGLIHQEEYHCGRYIITDKGKSTVECMKGGMYQ